jgi:hypothetical protein
VQKAFAFYTTSYQHVSTSAIKKLTG